MSFKRVLLIAGTALLAAACNSGLTAPVGVVRGGAASNAKAAASDTTKTATPPAATQNSENNEYCGWTVQLGWSDSSCANPEG